MKRILDDNCLTDGGNFHFANDDDVASFSPEVKEPASDEWLEFIRNGGLPALEAVLAPVARSVAGGETLH